MSILDRILLTLLALASLCVAILACLQGIGALNDWSSSALTNMYTYPGDVYTVVFSVVLALIAIRFLFYRRGTRELDYVVLQGEYGDIRISFTTIQQLSNRTGKSVRGVQDFDTRVRNGQAGILLAVKVRALPDLELARMSAEIQTAVKEYVEKTTGVAVERIAVNIVELASGAAKSSKTWVD